MSDFNDTKIEKMKQNYLTKSLSQPFYCRTTNFLTDRSPSL